MLKLLARPWPRGAVVEVGRTQVTAPSGTVLLSGRYRVPGGASRIEIEVPLYAGSATTTSIRGRAFLSVGP